MFPKLFDLGPLSVYSYGVLLALSYFIGLSAAVIRARRRGLDGDRIMDLGVWIILSALAGAKLLLVLVDFDYFRAHPWDLFSIARAGGVFYGGLLLAVVVGIWYVRKHHMPVWSTADIAAPGIALGQFVGRIGCFLAGCCYGSYCARPWAVTFTSPVAAELSGTPLNVPLHPVQLYESAAVLGVFFAVLWIERRPGNFTGRTFWSYVLLYGIVRFATEMFRGDPRGHLAAGLSTSQVISLGLVPLAVAMLVVLSRRAAAAGVPAAGARQGRHKR
jgi:phosphatidylglycerol:prolipoprotein diacylglycerol transferase